MNLKGGSALIKKFEKYYQENRGKSLYFYPLALLYCAADQKQKAYQILLEGLKFFPRYVLALIKIAEILMDEGKYQAATAYLETAVNIDRTNTTALRKLALCYEKTSQIEKAIEIYKKLTELNPKDDEARSKLLELAPHIKPDTEQLDSILSELDDEEEGKPEDIPKIELEEAEDEDTDTEEMPTITLARLYEKQGHIEDAIRVYEKLLELEPDNMEAKEELERLKKEIQNEKDS